MRDKEELLASVNEIARRNIKLEAENAELKRTTITHDEWYALCNENAKLKQQVLERNRRIDDLALIRCRLEQQLLERNRRIDELALIRRACFNPMQA